MRTPCVFLKDPPATEIYTLSLHDALPIFRRHSARLSSLDWIARSVCAEIVSGLGKHPARPSGCSTVMSSEDRKSTRLNSSHSSISYAVFCLKKKTRPLILLTLQMHNAVRS